MNEEPIRILLVEDEDDHAILITRAFELSSLKVEITRARTLREALAGLRDTQPHFVILDYLLPDGNGIDLLKQCGYYSNPCYPILFVTSHGNEKIAVDAMKAGAMDYLIKSEAIYLDMPHLVERTLREWGLVQERKQAESDLKEKQRLNETLLNSLPHPAMLIRKDRTILAANEIALEAGAKIGGRCWETFGHSDFISDEDKKYIQIHKEAPPCGTKCWFCRAEDSLQDKKLIHIDVYSRGSILDTYWVPLNDDQFLHYAVDVTERKKMEEALRESQDQFQAITFAANDAIIMIDDQGHATYWNRAAHEIFGFSGEEVLGKELTEFIVPERYRGAHYVGFQGFRKTGQGRHIGKTIELAGLRKKGEEFPLELSLSSVKHKDRWYAVATIRDITERKSLESQLIQSEKLSGIGTFVSGVAHELNNPLTAVLGFSRQLMEREYPPDEMREKLEIIAAQSERTVGIVQSLLKFSRKHVPGKAPVSINDCLEGALSLQAYQLKADNIEIRKSYDPDLPLALGDMNQLQQVFMNIILNAHHSMKSARKKGVLRVETRQINGEIVVTLENEGPPISEANIGKIFDPFFTTKKVGEGVGLGLYVSYGIVQDHQGTVRAGNVGEQGVRFTITLPAIEEATEERKKGTEGTEERIEDAKPSVLSVLIVEDEESIRKWVYEILAKEKFLVMAARNGKEATELIKRRKFDVILTDIKMPEMDGLSLAKWLIDEMPGYPGKLILATGSLDEKYSQFCRTHGGALLQKPYTREELLEAIGEVMRGEL